MVSRDGVRGGMGWKRKMCYYNKREKNTKTMKPLIMNTLFNATTYFNRT